MRLDQGTHGVLISTCTASFSSPRGLVPMLKAFTRSNEAPAERLCHVSTIQMLPVESSTGRVASIVLELTVKRAL